MQNDNAASGREAAQRTSAESSATSHDTRLGGCILFVFGLVLGCLTGYLVCLTLNGVNSLLGERWPTVNAHPYALLAGVPLLILLYRPLAKLPKEYNVFVAPTAILAVLTYAVVSAASLLF